MRIESQSLSGFLYNRYDSIEDEDRRPEKEDLWRHILKFPGESWPKDFGKDGVSILDPSRVLGRMFCVKIDRYMEAYLRETSDLRIHAPISWLLRLAPEKEWRPEDVLIFCQENTQGAIAEELIEIQRDFPEVFTYDTPGDRRSAMAEFRKLLKNSNKEFREGDLLHISAPKFHKSWEALVGAERVNNEDASKAKQQWSMSVNGELEDLCEGAIKGCTILQAGGGHILLLVHKGKGKDMKRLANGILKKIRDGFVEERKWSPKLWATWKDGFLEKEHGSDISPEEIIEGLRDAYRDDEERRKSVKAAWRIFKFGRRKPDLLYANSENRAIVYLDVIGLGDHCWPKLRCENCNIVPEGRQCEKCGSPPRQRNRGDTIAGFKKSRKITAVIESTFGLVFAKHLPEEVLSMGGDEMIARIDSNDWLELVENVETHSKKMHATIFDEELRLLWWAMKSEGPQPPASDFKHLKETVRMLTDKEKVRLMRFVNPMWTSIIDDLSDDSGDGGSDSGDGGPDKGEEYGDGDPGQGGLQERLVEEYIKIKEAKEVEAVKEQERKMDEHHRRKAAAEWATTMHRFWDEIIDDWGVEIHEEMRNVGVNRKEGEVNYWVEYSKHEEVRPAEVENTVWFGTDETGHSASIFDFREKGEDGRYKFALTNLQGTQEGTWIQHVNEVVINLDIGAALFRGSYVLNYDEPVSPVIRISGEWINPGDEFGWDGSEVECSNNCHSPVDVSRMEIFQSVSPLHDDLTGEVLDENHLWGYGYRYHCESCKLLTLGGWGDEVISFEVKCPKCEDSSDVIHLGRGGPWCECCQHDLEITHHHDMGWRSSVWGKCMTEDCESCKSPPTKILMWAAGEAGDRVKLFDKPHDARKQWNRIHDEHGSSWWRYGDKSEKLAKAVIKKIWVPVR